MKLTNRIRPGTFHDTGTGSERREKGLYPRKTKECLREGSSRHRAYSHSRFAKFFTCPGLTKIREPKI